LRDALLLSNREQSDYRHALLGLKALGPAWESAGIAARKRLLAGPLAIGRELLRATDAARATRVDAEARGLAEDGIGIEPGMILTGDVLVSWGYRPGPAFKAILSGVYDAQLEGRVKNLEEARELVTRLSV
jgi:poly(A) polymerase